VLKFRKKSAPEQLGEKGSCRLKSMHLKLLENITNEKNLIRLFRQNNQDHCMKIKKRTGSPAQLSSDLNRKPPLGLVGTSALRFGSSTKVRRAWASGFTLMETLVAMVTAGVLLPPIFTGLAFAVSSMQGMRENLRATQIVVQRMESMRLAAFKTLQDPAAYPATSTEYYSPSGQASGKGGTAYTVTYNWTPKPASLPPSYRTNMMLVTVTASWNSGKTPRTRSMQSYVARYGIQRYVCEN
jgi:type II secretory pathway pseudopilin PulG